MAILNNSGENVLEVMNSFFLSDHSMACRLERAEAAANVGFVEAHARLDPTSGAEWIEVAGTYAMFDGVRSPCTQTFGLGLFQLPTLAELDKLETFFKDRQAPVFHEVSPLAYKALFPILNERCYQPVEFTTVMFLPVDDSCMTKTSESDPLQVRIVGKEDRDLWARTAAEGWREDTEFADIMLDLARITATRTASVLFLAELRDQPIAAANLAIHDRVALFAGASTIPRWRRQGAQNALLRARLGHAASAGCDLAMFCAAPGSGSQRNAERQGFRIAYTRVKFGRTLLAVEDEMRAV